MAESSEVAFGVQQAAVGSRALSRGAAGDGLVLAMAQAVLGAAAFDQHGGFKSIVCQGWV